MTRAKKRKKRFGIAPRLPVITVTKKTILLLIILKRQMTSYSRDKFYISDYKYGS